MIRNAARRSPGFVLGSFALVLTGCGSAPAPSEVIGGDAPAVERTAEPVSGCDTVSAGQGWLNASMAELAGSFHIEFSNYPSSPATPALVDAVVGFSDGPADSFRDLGPIVRFNDYGYIDVRDGDAYTGAFPYRTGDGAFDIILEGSLTTHRYSAWVRHRDSPTKPFEVLAEDIAFRSEQSAVTKLDTIGRFVDSEVGSLESCRFSVTPE